MNRFVDCGVALAQGLRTAFTAAGRMAGAVVDVMRDCRSLPEALRHPSVETVIDESYVAQATRTPGSSPGLTGQQ